MFPKSLATTGFVLLFILQFTNTISSDVKDNDLSGFDKVNNSQDFNVPKDEETNVKKMKIEDNEAENSIGVTPRENGQDKNKLRGSQEEDTIIDKNVYRSFFEDVISKIKSLTGNNDYCNVSCATGSCGGRCSICNNKKICTDTPDTPITCGDGCTLSSECPSTCPECRTLNGFRQCASARIVGQCRDSCSNDFDCAPGDCSRCAWDQFSGQLTCQEACGGICTPSNNQCPSNCPCQWNQPTNQYRCTSQLQCGQMCDINNSLCPGNCPCQWNPSISQYQCGASISLQCGQACSMANNGCPANCPCGTNNLGHIYCGGR